MRILSCVLLFVFFIVFLKDSLYRGLRLEYFPSASWSGGLFSGEPRWFYFGRLIEFFPIYIFSFIVLFYFNPKGDKGSAFIRICAWVILLFFIGWGNFQSRYILSGLPFLLLLSAKLVSDLFNKIISLETGVLRGILKGGLFVSLYYIFLKTYFVNTHVSFSNNFCYF